MDYKEIVDSIWNDALGDATYSASRTLNGLSFGALDYLGNKYGVDTQMNDYLSKKPLKNRQYMQQFGDIAQIGGSLLWGGAIGKKAIKSIPELGIYAVRWNGRRSLLNQLKKR